MSTTDSSAFLLEIYNLVSNPFNIPAIISIALGLLSLLLAIFAIYQSYRYNKLAKKAAEEQKRIEDKAAEDQKKLAAKVAEDQEELLWEIRGMTTNLAMVLRDVDRQIPKISNGIRLYKDEIYIRKTRAYDPSLREKIEKELDAQAPDFIKYKFIEKIKKFLRAGAIETVTLLKCECKKEDLPKFNLMRNSFKKYGIYIELKLHEY